MYSAYKLNKQVQYTASTYSFPNLEPVCCSMSSSNCCFLSCIQISQEAYQVVWYSHLFQNFAQFIVIHTVKDFGIVNKAERSCVHLFATPWTIARQAPLSMENSLGTCTEMGGHFLFHVVSKAAYKLAVCSLDLQDLMPEDLKWSWCSNNRNEVQVSVTCLNHSKTILWPPDLWKNCLPWNWSLVPKRLGTTAVDLHITHQFRTIFGLFSLLVSLKEWGALWKCERFMRPEVSCIFLRSLSLGHRNSLFLMCFPLGLTWSWLSQQCSGLTNWVCWTHRNRKV